MFPEELKALRKERKLSQAALAARLGITQQAIAKWESACATPDPQTLLELAEIFHVSVDRLLGSNFEKRISATPIAPAIQIPILGTVKAGYGAYAFEEDLGTEPANVKNARDYFYLIVQGNSMEPQIREGDLALIHRQPDVENGELAVVLVNGEEGTIKRVLKKDGAIILQPFNPAYQSQIYIGKEIYQLTILGKIVETKSKW